MIILKIVIGLLVIKLIILNAISSIGQSRVEAYAVSTLKLLKPSFSEKNYFIREDPIIPKKNPVSLRKTQLF